MRLLLDTHVFLWLISGSPEIPRTVLSAIRDPRNQVFLSVASVWDHREVPAREGLAARTPRALRSNLVFVTVDARIRAYPVTLMVWT